MDRQTDGRTVRPTDRQTDRHTDIVVHWEVTLPKRRRLYSYAVYYFLKTYPPPLLLLELYFLPKFFKRRCASQTKSFSLFSPSTPDFCNFLCFSQLGKNLNTFANWVKIYVFSRHFRPQHEIWPYFVPPPCLVASPLTLKSKEAGAGGGPQL